MWNGPVEELLKELCQLVLVDFVPFQAKLSVIVMHHCHYRDKKGFCQHRLGANKKNTELSILDISALEYLGRAHTWG